MKAPNRTAQRRDVGLQGRISVQLTFGLFWACDGVNSPAKPVVIGRRYYYSISSESNRVEQLGIDEIGTDGKSASYRVAANRKS